MTVNAIETQGRSGTDKYLMTYILQFSEDNSNWIYYNGGEVLTANQDDANNVLTDLIPF